ncbi:MAG TPA: choice-of-anchor D domain-containing protein [Anaerolineales bacterium]|nr:choice-of-anchor D domain-containing protein [Anaerolineales bacterium]
MHTARRSITIATLIVLVLVSLPPNQAAGAVNPKSALGSGMDAQVKALVVDGSGNLYAGGFFTTAGGTSANYVARWDGSSWSAVGGGPGGYVDALAVDGDGNLYAGGGFGVAKWDGSSWTALGTGAEGEAYAVAVDDSGNVYARLSTHDQYGAPWRGVGKWNGSAWSKLGAIYLDGDVETLAVDGSGNLYAGGTFNYLQGSALHHLTRWNGSAWSSVGSWSDDYCLSCTDIRSLAIDGSGNLVAGGHFSQSSANVDRWNGSSWTGLGTGVGDNVYAVAADDSNVYAGGTFSEAGGAAAQHIARWDGSAWQPVGGGISGDVLALAADPAANALYAAGRTYVGGSGYPYVGFVLKFSLGLALDVNPTSLSFGNQAVNTASSAKTITITNAGTAALTLGSIHLPDMYVNAASTTCTYGMNLAANASCALDVKFYPDTLGTFNGDITIESNAPDSPASVPVSGRAVGGGELSANPASLSFDDQLAGTASAIKNITLTNTGTESVTLSFLSFPTKFVNASLSTCTYARTLAVGEACILAVLFYPNTVGTFSGDITIESNAGVSPLSVPVSATAVAGTQLLKNPGFEVDANANKVPDMWTVGGFVAATDRRDCTVRNAGNCSLKLVGNGKLKTVRQTVAKSGGAGDDFTYSLWLRTSNVALPSGGAHSLKITFYNGAAKGAVRTLTFPVGTHPFQRISGTFRAYAAYTRIEFVLSSGASRGTIWLDGANLTWAP